MRRIALPFIIIVGILFLNFSANPPQRSTGAPGEGTCAQSGCHSVGSSSSGQISLKGMESQIDYGTTYALSVELSRSVAAIARGGFQMVIVDAEGNNVGSFSNPGQGTTTSQTAGRQYAEHQPAKSFSSDMISYEVDWTSPEDMEVDSLTVFIAALFADGNGSRQGDNTVVDRIGLRFAKASNLSVSGSVTDAACGMENGSIITAISGGEEPYAFEWSTGATTKDVANLRSGTYMLKVTDAAGATVNTSFEVGNGDDTTPPLMTCAGDTLRIGACVPFSYSVPTATDDCDGSVTVSLISGLGPNSRYPLGISHDVYEAVDAAGNATRCTIVIKNEPDIDVNLMVFDMNCYTDEYGSVVADITGGNEPYTITTADTSVNLSQLTEGTYELTITDKTGCQYQESVTITRPDELVIDTLEITDARTMTSGDGAISVEVSGGTAPYAYYWYTEDELFSRDQELERLFPGDYILVLYDANGCQSQSDTLSVDFTTSVATVLPDEALSIYPTIITDTWQIDNNSGLRIADMALYDLGGQRYEMSERLGHLRAGLYVVQVTMESGEIYRQKIIRL